MITLAQLAEDPHPRLARLRATAPVLWLPALGGWMVTTRALALAVMRDAETFTVDDPRFTTGQVTGPSMLSLDGTEHARHREPFTDPFRPGAVHGSYADAVQQEADRLLDSLAGRDEAEIRREFAGPLAATTMTDALGLDGVPAAQVLRWYDAIVHAVHELTEGRPAGADGHTAYAALREAVAGTVDAAASRSLLVDAARALELPDLTANAAVLLFGGIETTEAMITNLLFHLLSSPEQSRELQAEPDLLDNAIEESLRLEPAAAVVDRYATRDVRLAGAEIRKGDLVTVSLAAANRDPSVFPDPDRFDLHRPNSRRQLAFAHGPHYCLGAHLARLETRIALRSCLDRLDGLRLDPSRPAAVHGLVFRKPAALWVQWDR
ncbi:cytochrome P450 [Streptomyces brasiliensis]|uniref:Cytochrome P450 n=1 Tax=Streptomyces brasiliensis TaxID=1954 RepID=A0A917L646_9ACTN|nr:cytochrome P450 [Streptomyces brasiliensis]GGJ41555.1 cytochrome P450 [Streptomyces brasiliensis]